jgi:hypothetical protein
VVHLSSDAHTLVLHTLAGGTVRLLAADAPMLSFWYVGLQQLASVPHAERVTRGALLWRAARCLWREQRGSAGQRAAAEPWAHFSAGVRDDAAARALLGR